MHAALLSLLTGDPNVDQLDSELDSGLPAVSLMHEQYLDGRTITHGRLAAHYTEDVDKPVVTESGISTETEEVTRSAVAEVFVDLEAGWCGTSSSTGEQLLADYLISRAGVAPEPTTVDLTAWATNYRARDDASVWGLSYSDADPDDPEAKADHAGAQYHYDARMSDLDPDTVSLIGFSYDWDGRGIRGVLSRSGYAAVYSDWVDVATYARWVADEIQPYLRVGDTPTAQQELATNDDGEPDECVDCGRDTGLNDQGLCIVCQDARNEDEEVRA